VIPAAWRGFAFSDVSSWLFVPAAEPRRLRYRRAVPVSARDWLIAGAPGAATSPAVLAGMCVTAKTGHDVLASAEFAARLGEAAFERVGEYEVKGFATPIAAFAPLAST